MKLYSTKGSLEQNLQTLYKTCFTLDKEIASIVNFIDAFNANYIILNRLSDFKDTAGNPVYYYTDEQLAYNEIIQYTNEPYWFDIDKMRPHQIIENHFGKDVFLKLNSTLTDVIIPQGYALRHEGFNSQQEPQYSIISLASSGAYYILTNVSYNTNGINLHWGLQPNATDLYGLNYTFSILYPDERCYYHGQEENLISCTNLQSPVIIPNFSGSYTNVVIGSRSNSLWTTSKVLWHEFYLDRINNNNQVFEEIIDDSKSSTSVTRVGETPQSRYTITTNLIPNSDMFINLV